MADTIWRRRRQGMASGGYRNGVHKGASAGSNLKSSSFKSKHPPVAAPGSGLRRSSSASLGSASGSNKDDGGGKFRAKGSFTVCCVDAQTTMADKLDADSKMRKLGLIRLTLRFHLLREIWFVCYWKMSHWLLGYLAIVLVFARSILRSRMFFFYFKDYQWHFYGIPIIFSS